MAEFLHIQAPSHTIGLLKLPVSVEIGNRLPVLMEFMNMPQQTLSSADPFLSDSEPKDKLIRGTSRKDELSGDLGDDTVEGLSGDDVLFGGAGNDKLYGGNGRDVLTGYGPEFIFASFPGIAVGVNFDELTGGRGRDTFILDDGQYSNPFYSGRRGIVSKRGHASISDFSRSQGDQIQIRGEIDEYRVMTRKDFGGSADNDSAIFKRKDLIAIVYDVVDLKKKDFISVELILVDPPGNEP